MMVNKLNGMIFVLIGGLALLTWHYLVQNWQIGDPPLVFRQISEYKQPEVERCLMKGNGSSTFSEFTPLGIPRGRGASDMNHFLVDGDGSQLFIGLEGLDTLVTLHSHHAPSEKQLDVLQWCATRLTEVWFPKHIRDQ